MDQIAHHKPWYKYLAWIIAIILVVVILRFVFAYNEIVVSGDSPKEDRSAWCDVSGLFGYCDDRMPEDFVDPYPLPEEEQHRLDILLLGMRGEDDEEPAGQWLTDTIMLASIDTTTNNAALVSLPRDLYVDMWVPEFDDNFRVRGKLNEVYVLGLQEGGGIALTKQVVSKITGVHVDHAVVVDFEAFVQVIDTLDGIDIYLNEPFVESEQWGYPFELPAGENHLDSEDALYYVRSRFSSSDFDRARRQRQVIQAIKEKAFSVGILTNPVRVHELLSALQGHVRTDIQLWELDDAIELANQIQGDNVEHIVLSPLNALREGRGPNNEYILLPLEDNYQSIQEFIKN